MKQGILPRNHLPVKAVIGVMGAAVRHISWSNIITNVICPFVLFNDGYGCEGQHPKKVLTSRGARGASKWGAKGGQFS